MAHFIISFRIKSDDTYQERYDSFIQRIAEISKEGAWEETSSFYALEADGNAESVCQDLWLKSKFNAHLDVMLVIDVHNREKATKGEIKYPNTLARCLGF